MHSSVVLLLLCVLLLVPLSSSMSKVCALFGYGPGLGAAMARKWSSEGFKVALMSRTLDKVKAAELEIPNSKGYACDVTSEADVKTAVEAIENDLGPVDCLIYNAGSGVFKTWDKLSVAELESSFQINVSGLLAATQCIAPQMIQRGRGGAIMITGATASLRGKPFTAGFAPPKGAQRMLAQALARDLGPKGIHVGYFIIDGQVGKSAEGDKIDPDEIANTYWHVASQPKSCWSFETEVRPSVENW